MPNSVTAQATYTAEWDLTMIYPEETGEDFNIPGEGYSVEDDGPEALADLGGLYIRTNQDAISVLKSDYLILSGFDLSDLPASGISIKSISLAMYARLAIEGSSELATNYAILLRERPTSSTDPIDESLRSNELHSTSMTGSDYIEYTISGTATEWGVEDWPLADILNQALFTIAFRSAMDGTTPSAFFYDKFRLTVTVNSSSARVTIIG